MPQGKSPPFRRDVSNEHLILLLARALGSVKSHIMNNNCDVQNKELCTAH